MTVEKETPDQLEDYNDLDYLPEKEYDTITTLAAQICKTPVAILSLADKERSCFKSVFGIEEQKTKMHSLPFHILHQKESEPSIINDIQNKSFLINHPFIQEHAFHFYAGVPLISASGDSFGTLCVLDYKPSTLDSGQLNTLQIIGNQAVCMLELHKRHQVMHHQYGLFKQIEKKTELENVNFEALINTTSDDIWSIDTEYKLISFNRAFSNKMEILTGKKVYNGQYALFADKIPADMHLQFKSYFDRALSGESFRDEYCRREKFDTGLDIWIELNGNPIYQNGKITGAAFFARTITQRKQAELKTQQSEANYRMLFESSPVPKMLLDVDTLHILEVNTATVSKYGYKREELLGKSIGKLFREEDVIPFFESIQVLRGRNSETKLENIVHRKKNGELIQGEMLVHELYFEGQNCFLTVLNDQTEHLKTASIRSQMANILENSLNEIYVFDTKELRFLYVNRGAILNIGYSLKELKQLTPYQIKPEFDELKFRDYLVPLLNDQKEQLVFVTKHERKDGSTYPVEVHLQKMWYEGQPAFVAIIIDITEAKASENKLQELNQLLEKSNDELEQFASITAHDLLEPLRMISGFTSLLEKKYADKLDEKGLKYLRFASDGSVRMQQMIKDILEYSRATTKAEDSETFNLLDVLATVINDLQLLIQSSGASIHLPESDLLLFGDKNAIYRLFLNLINNALKFTPDGKKPEIRIVLDQDEYQYQFTVSDNGIGIDPDHIKLLFKPYSRLNTRQKFEGTGLGLATCKKIVDYQGGTMWVTSQPNEGSQFHFNLPKTQG
ncbi:PAS domain S-box protein [Lunatibacter salilacus]|uniref:PAS domain S-box protein n=1 Tax=Lunatibacter salilacus TaxID=2483804 RepID=UPI00131E6788|nr:PAS domain S-box protein [Lunatibacter salilacus]